MTSAHRLTARLLRALDDDYNVIDMRAIQEVISVLENINITKELLETTRLGKHVNELRRKTEDVALARRTKLLLKKWRDLVIPDKSGSKSSLQPTSAESTPRQSPYASRGISPAVTPSVTPQICSPQVSFPGLNTSQKQGSVIATVDSLKSGQVSQKRQPLTSPALHNFSSNVLSSRSQNLSPNFTNTNSGQKIISPTIRSMSPNIKIASPITKNASPRSLNPSPSMHIVSPALRISSEATWNATPSKDPYDSDSQDVIFVDDNVDDTRMTFGSNSNSGVNFEHSERAVKRPRSPLNGTPDIVSLNDESRRGDKRMSRESSGRKAKKRRNHTKLEDQTKDHSVDVVSVGSPFLPVSSASTSPALSTSGSMRNGLTQSNPPVVSLIDDTDSRSPAPIVDSKSKSSSSRKNGCKKPPIEVDDYSNFIKNKIPTGGRKVKSTKEILEEMQAKKLGKILPAPVTENMTKPKEDFLTTYDSQKQLKKETVVVTDIIELNDSNSSSKVESARHSPIPEKDNKSIVKDDGKSESDEKVKFEPLDVILSRLPPIDYNWSDNESIFTPVCTCTVIYDDPELDCRAVVSPAHKKSIFELDNEETVKKDLESVSTFSNFEIREDTDCHAAMVYQKKPSEIANYHIDALHNCYIVDVNGTKSQNKKKEIHLACRLSSWGLRPFYDCTRDLFHNVVPKYNYLDYSLDKCVKNLSSIVMKKYDPVDISDPSEYLSVLEKDYVEKWVVKSNVTNCDIYQTSSDSPFCERVDSDDDQHVENEIDSDVKNSDYKKSNIDLDKDKNANSRENLDKVKISSSKAVNSKESDNDKQEKRNNCFEVLDYEVGIQCQPFSTLYSKCLFLDDIDYSDENMNVDNKQVDSFGIINLEDDGQSKMLPSDECLDLVSKPMKKFTYEDSISLLPISLPALNSYVTYDSSTRLSADLSCIFRTKFNIEDPAQNEDDLPSKDSCELSYNLVSNTKILEMKSVSNSVLNRTRDLYVEDHNENANCDSDVKKSDLNNELTNSGAFVNDSGEPVETCVMNGCPTWIPGLNSSDDFREWHESVVRTSYNEEPLTVLPYVVID